jgi:hypothetical protein
MFRNINISIYKAIILPVVLYGCETLYLTIRKEYRLRMFENRVMKRIFGPKIDEVIRGRRNSIMIIRIMESRRTMVGRGGMHIGYWWKSQKARDH